MDKYKISLTIELDLKKVYLNLVTHTEKGLKRTLIEVVEKTILDDYGADLGTIVSEKEKEASEPKTKIDSPKLRALINAKKSYAFIRSEFSRYSEAQLKAAIKKVMSPDWKQPAYEDEKEDDIYD